MKTPWYMTFLSLCSGSLRRLVGGWSLERKSLLFLGVALVVPIGLAFWFVLQVVANQLVIKTTQQAARDYARAETAWRHFTTSKQGSSSPAFPDRGVLFDPETYKALRIHLVENPDYDIKFLMLDDEALYQNLPSASRPSDPREEQLLRRLEERYRAGLESLEQVTEKAIEKADAAKENEQPSAAGTAPSFEPKLNNEFFPSQPLSEIVDVESDPDVDAARKMLESLFDDNEGKPQFPAAGESIPTPDEGWYVYYHVVNFAPRCIECHSKYREADVGEIPFRAVKVYIPFSQAQVASSRTLAIMIAIAMVTIAATLLVVHWVFRRIVVKPLRHLHAVSDEISRGNTNLRANIDTGDEFNELADAFNRMLMHMTDGQEKLRQLNTELDLRVDQLAQANLNLYEANRLKSDFLANMSHELRTPLNSIIGFSDVLRDISSLDDKQKKYATNIQSSGKLLLELINDILDLAKVEAGKMQVSPSSFDLDGLISAQCDMLHALVDEKNVDLRTEFSNNLQPVFQDKTKLQQILTNLLSNAIKFTPDGGMITVRAELLSPNVFQVQVIDTGVGIPESDFEIIFEKFRQSNAVLQNDGLTRQYAGTGLGLSIVKELCKLLGGEVRLSSQLGTGSTFRVLLPVHFDAGKAQELALK